MREYGKVACAKCGGKYYRITNTHLFSHGMTMEDYREIYPGAQIEDPALASDRVAHLRGKTYEEIYGPEEAALIIAEKRDSALEAISDPVAGAAFRDSRNGALGLKRSEENNRRNSLAHTIHGGTTYSKRALAHHGAECVRCGEDDPKKLVVHHKAGSNVLSPLADHSLQNLEVLCRSCHAKWHNKLRREAGKFRGLADVEKGIHYVLIGLKKSFGLDLADGNFDGTPKRVARAYFEIFSGLLDTDDEARDILGATFAAKQDEMVVCSGIEAFSMCPHHLLPVELNIDIAYIPKDKVLGLSKLARLAILLAARPMLQEKLSCDIADKIMEVLKPMGAACRIRGRHMCVAMRGVRSTKEHTTTSALRGAFKSDPATRAEFMALIGGSK